MAQETMVIIGVDDVEPDEEVICENCENELATAMFASSFVCGECSLVLMEEQWDEAQLLYGDEDFEEYGESMYFDDHSDADPGL